MAFPTTSLSTRRAFLRRAGIGMTAALAVPKAAPRALAATALSLRRELFEKRSLIVIQLQGGHDGLNCFVPFADDDYYRQRPTLAIRRDELIPLSETTALHRAAQPLEPLLKDGKLVVAADFGIPGFCDSHYRATEIWQTASACDQHLYSGWAGRCFSSLQQREPALALHGFYSSPSARRLFAREEDRAPSSEQSPRPPLALTALNNSVATAFDHLREIGELAGCEADRVEIFSVQLPGFDTHAREGDAQRARLHALASSLAALQTRLEERRVAHRVLTVVFSEFGRSAVENTQGGTDHGPTSPVFFMGEHVKPGLFPSYSSGLNSADTRVRHDFRKVVRTVACEWLRVPTTAIFAADPGSAGLLQS